MGGKKRRERKAAAKPARVPTVISDARFKGTVTWFDSLKGYGFIQLDEGDREEALEALERAAAARGGEGRPAGAQPQAPQPAGGADSTGKGGRTRARAA